MTLVQNAFITVSLLISLIQAFETPPTVTVAQGVLRGKIKESAISRRKYAAFTSIPYAKPPIGGLRFKEPVPAESWIGTLDATRDAPLCIQQNFFVAPRTPLVSGSEDCLYLNVFTPKLPGETGFHPLEVLFKIHGGAFMTFSSSEYSEDRVLDRDVVFVSVNYRLASFGFLSTQDSTVSGNNGLKDQLLALKWVKNNIASFGGDPNKITLTGVSAGAACVHMLLLSPQSKGLFQRAMMESGACPPTWSLSETPVEHAQQLAAVMGCPTSCSKTMVDCLRQRPAEHIATATVTIMNWNATKHLPFVPTIEPPSSTAFLTKHPLEILANKEAHDVPLLMSVTSDEGLLVLADKLGDMKALDIFDMFWNVAAPGLLDFNHTVPEDKRAEVAATIKQHYFGDKKIMDDPGRLVQILTDRMFAAPMIQAVKLHAKQNHSPVYLYEFGYRGIRRSADRVLSRDVYDGVNHGEHSMYVIPVPEILQLHPDDQPMAENLLDLYMTFMQGKPMPGNWKTVQEGLPKINLMKVNQPEWSENKLETHDDYGNSEFWKSLEINGYKSVHSSHSEL